MNFKIILMKKIALLLLFSCLMVGSGFAQTVATSYLQTKNTGGTYISSMTGGTGTLFGANWSGATASTASLSLPFSFYFNGTAYTTVYVNPNGYITFGAASASTNYTPLSTPTTGVTGTVAALACSSLKSANAVAYGYTGTSPNRIFTIQWTTAGFNTGITACTISFEINLYEKSNKAEVVYSAPTRATPNTTLATQVGIGGASSSDYVNWMENASSTAAYAVANSQGVSWLQLRPGTANSSNCTLGESAAAYFPAANLAFDWTPNLNLLSPSNFTHTGCTLNWTAATGATSYTVDVATSSTFSTGIVSGSPFTASSNSQVITGLTTGTTYYYRVTPVYASGGFNTVSPTNSVIMPVDVPLSLTSGSYNYDVIANGSNKVAGTGAGSVSFTGGTYGGTDQQGYSIIAPDFFNAGALATIPQGGSYSETRTNGTIYQFAPYNQNNALYFATGSTSAAGTMTLTNPIAVDTLFLLNMAIVNTTSPTFTVTVNFTDATSQVFTGITQATNWCTAGSTPFAVIGRTNEQTAAATADGSSTCEYLQKFTLALSVANNAKLVQSVTVQQTAATGSYGMIFGISAHPTATLTTSSGSLSGFATTTCTTPSTAQTVTVTGAHLVNPTANVTGTGNIVATAPLGYKISADGITYGKTANLAFVNCAFSGSLYARLDTNVAGTYTGNITFSGAGIPAATLTAAAVAVSGTVSGLSYKAAGATSYPSTISTVYMGAVTEYVASSPIVDSFIGSGLTGNVTLTSSNPDFKLSLDNISYSSSVTIPVTGSTISPAVPVYTVVTASALGADVSTITVTGGTSGCPIKDSVYGQLICVNPSLPTALTFASTTATSTSVGFTPTGTADGYLLVRSTSAFVPGSDPITAHTYAVNDAFGNGTVVAINTVAPPYSATGLTGNTNYYFTVVPYNGGTGGSCTGGPLYASGTQLTGSVTTCVGTPGTPVLSAITSTGFTATWTAPTGGSASAVGYLVDVSTSSTFSGGAIAGSPFSTTSLSRSFTGLAPNVLYYVRVTATGACNSAASATASTTTPDNYFTVAVGSGFNADIVANGSTAPQTTTSFPVSGVTSFDNAGYDLVGYGYSFATATRTLPNGGSFFSSNAPTALPVQLAPYTGTNALLLHSGASYPTQGTLTFTTPVYANTIYVTGMSGSGTTGVTYRINYTDGSSDSANTTVYTYPDWYTTTTTSGNTTICQAGVGRVSSSSTPTAGETSTTSPSLSWAAVPVTTAGYAKKVQSIRATYNTSTGYLGLMAVSARAGLLNASASSLTSFGTIASCSTSSSQNFTITGGTLYPTAGSIVATAPTGFQVSSDNATWGATATFTYTGNAMTAVPVYVRFAPTSIGSFSGNVTFTGGTVNTPPTIAVSGVANGGVLVTPAATFNFGPVSVTTISAAHVDTVNGNGLTAGTITVTSSNSAFQVSPDSATWSSNYTFANGSTVSAPIYIRYAPTVSGSDSSTITLTGAALTCNAPSFKVFGAGSNPCSTPAAASALTFTGTTSTGTTLNFTPGSAAEGYIVLQGSSTFTGSLTDGTNYTVGTVIPGGATVLGIFTGATSPISITSGTVPIVGNTTYNITIVPFNGGVTGICGGGPLYASTYLQGTYTTCPGVATSLTSSAVTGAGFTAGWTAPAGGSANTIYYVLDVSTSATFASAVTTYVTTSTSYLLNTLSGTTTYYFRVHDSTSACVSGYTSTALRCLTSKALSLSLLPIRCQVVWPQRTSVVPIRLIQRQPVLITRLPTQVLNLHLSIITIVRPAGIVMTGSSLRHSSSLPETGIR